MCSKILLFIASCLLNEILTIAIAFNHFSQSKTSKTFNMNFNYYFSKLETIFSVNLLITLRCQFDCKTQTRNLFPQK